MPSLLVVVFLVELGTKLVSAIGAETINNFIWTLLNYLPISTAGAAKQQRKLQSEYLVVRRELNATSSQDEFAKWAKLRRKHDKLLEQLEATKKGMESAKSSFDKYLTAIRLLITRAPQYAIPFWYATEPMFWLPHGWFPWYAEWIISFPRAPMGSVSIASWQLACTGVIALFSDLISGIYGLLVSTKQKEAPVPAAGAKKPQQGSASEKEL
ncbi:hypothetical protein N3K66_003159 [Trichothecium roseum]|uniref:Uncharacterized protein n=1 Tax=Trichothecium roseum TaxID=47278 RepID=A0ACC0V785_9HYPO|nr:hypothetical protein N3K66_003159 [Trichothecium roseum]